VTSSGMTIGRPNAGTCRAGLIVVRRGTLDITGSGSGAERTAPLPRRETSKPQHRTMEERLRITWIRSGVPSYFRELFMGESDRIFEPVDWILPGPGGYRAGGLYRHSASRDGIHDAIYGSRELRSLQGQWKGSLLKALAYHRTNGLQESVQRRSFPHNGNRKSILFFEETCAVHRHGTKSPVPGLRPTSNEQIIG